MSPDQPAGTATFLPKIRYLSWSEGRDILGRPAALQQQPPVGTEPEHVHRTVPEAFSVRPRTRYQPGRVAIVVEGFEQLFGHVSGRLAVPGTFPGRDE